MSIDPTNLFTGLHRMIDVARRNGFETITLTDLEQAINLAEDRAHEQLQGARKPVEPAWRRFSGP